MHEVNICPLCGHRTIRPTAIRPFTLFDGYRGVYRFFTIVHRCDGDNCGLLSVRTDYLSVRAELVKDEPFYVGAMPKERWTLEEVESTIDHLAKAEKDNIANADTKLFFDITGTWEL